MENKFTWGGSGIERVTFDFILNNIPAGSKILELGAGYVSTIALQKTYDLTSIDHQEKYARLNTNCGIHAPLVNGWYDPLILVQHLTHDYELIFIDGINREAFLENIHLFKNIKKVMVHDTYRDAEYFLSVAIAQKLQKKYDFFTDGDHFSYIH